MSGARGARGARTRLAAGASRSPPCATPLPPLPLGTLTFPEPTTLAALQEALEARIEADVTTSLGPLADLLQALRAYETAVREQLTRDAFAEFPGLATSLPAPDVPAARQRVLAALRAAARVHPGEPVALPRSA